MRFLKSVLFVVLVGFSTFIFAADYYVRADGTAANKAAATGPTSNAANCMNLAVYHAETFSAGDNIYFSDQGGDYTTIATIVEAAGIHIVSSGTVGNPIYYRNAPGESPYIDIKSQSTGYGMLVDDKDYVEVIGFNGAGSGNGAFYRVTGSAGTAGDGYTVVFRDSDIDRNYNETNPTTEAHDGYSLADSAEVLVYSPTIDKIRLNPANGGSIQALTTHTSAKMIVYDPVITDSQQWAVNTADSQITVHRATASGNHGTAIQTGTDVTANGFIKFYDSTLNCDETGGLAGGTSTTSDDALILIDGSTINITLDNATSNVTVYNRNILRLQNNDITINSSYHRWATWQGGITQIRGGTLTVTDARNYGMQTDPTGGEIQLEGTELVQTSTDDMFNIGTGSTADTWFIGFQVKDSVGDIIEIRSGITESITIADFTFVDCNADCILSAETTNGPNIYNGIFHNCTDPIHGTTGATISHNIYSGTSPNEGGTAALTSDPLFVNEAGDNFELQETSPAVGSGLKWWGNTGRPHGVNGEPKPDTNLDRGAFQSTWDANHPANL